MKLPNNGRRQRGEMKTKPQVSADMVKLSILQRFNPIKGLTPQLLATQLDNFNIGFISYCALTWDTIERRDYVIKGAAAKRRKAVAHLKWEVLTDEESPEAHEHAEALDYFYNNMTSVNAFDENERGGFSLLVRQMMDAVGKKYAAHELVWKPGTRGLSAEMRFVPLWFFENRTGRLQLITSTGEAQGTALDEGGWMITTGEGLMEASSVAYLFKRLPLNDWLAYCDRFGTPGILGRTNAAQGSDAGNAIREAVRAFGQNWSGVIYGDDGAITDPISLVSPEGAPNIPFEPLIERMDRMLTTLWLGSDLSSMSGSKDNNVGASVQGRESDLILAADAAMISETLNLYVDRQVIWQTFGTDLPRARVRLIVPGADRTEMDLKVDEFLLKAGVPLGQRERAEHYGRPALEDGDAPLSFSTPAADVKSKPVSLANESLDAKADRLARLVEDALLKQR